MTHPRILSSPGSAVLSAQQHKGDDEAIVYRHFKTRQLSLGGIGHELSVLAPFIQREQAEKSSEVDALGPILRAACISKTTLIIIIRIKKKPDYGRHVYRHPFWGTQHNLSSRRLQDAGE